MNSLLPATVKAGFISWAYASILLLLIIATAGKQLTAWLLIKLYELFIQHNSGYLGK